MAADRPDRAARDRPGAQAALKRDFPLLWEKAEQYDFAERLGGSTDPLLAEIDRALREIWDSRQERERWLGGVGYPDP